MDPLSPVASCLAVLSAIVATLRLYSTIHDAPEDALGVCKEVEDLQNVFSQSKEALYRRLSVGGLTQRGETAFHMTTVSIYEALTKLDRILRDSIVNETGNDGKKKVSRLAWLRNSAKIKKLCLRLRNLKADLIIVTTSQLVSDTVDVNAFMQNMAAGPLAELLSRQQSQELTLAELLEGQRQLQDSMVVPAMSSSAGYTSTPFITAASNQLRKRKRSLAITARDVQENTMTVNAEDVEVDDIESKCDTACSCICHRPSKVDSPALLESIFGTIHVGVTGALTSRTPCTERLCKRQKHRTAHFVYRFPTWMLARAITLSYSTRSSMQIVLRAPRIISDDAPILRFAAVGDLASIRSLMSRGLGSPADVGTSYGLTALHIAFAKKHIELCRFLVQHGADPYYETNLRRAVIDIVRDERINGKMSDEQKDQLDYVFDELDDYESFHLSPLHKTIVGLSRISLEMQLSTSTQYIDMPDSLGRTALSAAAWRGDAKSVRTLLQFGASANISTPTEVSPLHRAIEGRSYECVDLLIQHDANVNHKNKRGRLPLHYACRIDDNGEICRLLLQSGAFVDCEDHGKARPLHEAVMHGKTPQLKVLLQYGADMNCQTFDCEFPLNIAVAKNNIEAIRLLLDAGADPALTTMTNRTILHTAAECANCNTLYVLETANLLGLDPDAKDSDDCTAFQVLDSRCRREDVDSNMRVVFGRLIEMVRQWNYTGFAENAAEEDVLDEFHDALAEMSPA